MRHLYLILALCFQQLAAYAQKPLHPYSTNGISGRKSYDRKQKNDIFIGVSGGLTQFFGELNGQDMRSVLGVHIGKAFTKEFSVEMDFSAGKVGGEQSEFFNSYFVNEYNAIELLAKWDITEQFSTFEPGSLHLIVYGGIGQLYFSANAFDLDSGDLLRFTNSKLSARNPLFLRWGPASGPMGIKKTREGMLPLGTSLEFALFPALKISADYRFYFVRTDKMDATSGRRLINPEESESYSDTPDDKFSFLGISLTYHFGKPGKKKQRIKNGN
ncbi:hypothetical protein [Dyadobacter sp. Leaf189]|uniref:hypothetical protein n=1 Tax=Dyadobacter sp. Leaf189 TaxID=1736295 RepID=UPI0006F900FA|nr:hypothetical protein [Dyadobacter sp. Leaf189]KQS32756.1 hypothetical protein ASG33_01190 [Dyadobacter sp. Leaf189]